jgi:ferredoxin--NADP+ reductase
VRLLAGVEVGVDVSVQELLDAYDAVVLTYGASRDRSLDIPGEELPGSIAATDLVAWYCGHPDADRERIEAALAAATSVVVVGVGNVAVDVTRVLAKTVPELDQTDMPQHVLDALAASTVRDIHVLGRRGPAQATFTTKELRELGELLDAEVIVDPGDVVLDAASDMAVATDKAIARNVEVIREWSTRKALGKSRRIFLHFCARPVELKGDGKVQAVLVERTTLDGSGNAVGTGQFFEIPADAVVRSVGYRGTAIEGVPFDPSANVIPHQEGRVLDGGAVRRGEYVAGWIKRGPTGIIGTNKKDASATVTSLLADATAGVLPEAPEPTPGAFDAFLSERGIDVVPTSGWRAIDQAERALGDSRGRSRTTIHETPSMLAAAQG